MNNQEIINQAKETMKKWKANGSRGFFLEYYEAQTGHNFGTKEYDFVSNLLHRNKI